MNILANLKLRRKVLIAMAPLVVVVIFATLYSAIKNRTIYSSYSYLIDKDINMLLNLSSARALSNRYAVHLYQEIAELGLRGLMENSDSRQVR
jgi:two-component system sensor histidine kinase/response regulator